ncbi:MAG TPA: ribose 5-phosphate isomerase A, partial [Chloroflexota bacterium]
MSIDDQKRVASQFAADLVEDGMTVGLGSGSTAEVAVQALGARVQRGLKIVGVASSDRTARLAGALGIPLTTLEQ